MRDSSLDIIGGHSSFDSQETSGEATPSSLLQNGMLPRDRQEKTAYYDYAAEKQMSQADMKLFYQRSQMEQQKADGSARGSQYSPQASPTLTSRTYSNMDMAELSESIRSSHSGLNMAQR